MDDWNKFDKYLEDGFKTHDDYMRAKYEGELDKIIEVELTSAQYLDSEQRYTRSKLLNNELNDSEIDLEIMHDRFNQHDELALEVYCNKVFIGYIKKHNTDDNIDDFCFSEKGLNYISIKWHGQKLILYQEETVMAWIRTNGISTSSLNLIISANGFEHFEYDIKPFSPEKRLKERTFLLLRGCGDIDPTSSMSYDYLVRTTPLPKSFSKLTNLKGLYLYSIFQKDASDDINCDYPDDSYLSAVCDLVNLTELLIEKTNLTSLPENIGNLSNLTKLASVKNNHLTALPESIGDLSNLSYLDIIKNSDLTALPESIGNLARLTELHILRNYRLATLPENIGNLHNLTTLSIEGNDNLTTLPESIGNLTNLTLLWAIKNDIATIPESIGNLSNLTKLVIEQNDVLTTLPESIGNLSNLTELHISSNNITTLPESIGNLSNLTKLFIGYNNITTLPESIGNLSNLTELHISNNNITTLPESIGNLSNLTHLYISGNTSATLPENIGDLSSLTHLYISGNQLDTLPESISNLSNLSMLEIRNYSGTSLPKNIGNLSSLTELYILGGYGRDTLATLPESIGNLSNLTKLIIEQNDVLTTLPESIGNLNNLTHLDISWNNRLAILPDSIGNLKNLIELTIKSSFWGFTVPRSFKKLPKDIQESIPEKYKKNWELPENGQEKIKTNSYSNRIPEIDIDEDEIRL